jgi:DNA end-binding protein Ku
MARAFWKGVISFGMVAIPVNMQIAIESKTPDFHFLHKTCLTRPKQVLFCAKDNEYFSQADTVRGYEYTKGQYVVLSESDFDKVPVKTTHSIDIIGFTLEKDIDLIYYGGSHYLQPEKLGEKPFALLKAVLEKTGQVGIAKVAFQRREHLCCLRPLGKILALHLLHYKDEILPTDELVPPEQKVTKPELDMATKLVEAMTTGFKPDDYHDDYTAALEKMVQAKLKGVEIKAPEVAKVEMEDLMTALRKSVVAAGRH